MRKSIIALTILPILSAGSPVGAQGVREYGFGGPGGDEAPALHLSSAVIGGQPLIWSSSRGTLVTPAAHGGWTLGASVPIDRIIGLTIAPVGEPQRQVSYNDPDGVAAAVYPGTVLVPLLRPRRPAKLRGEYP